MIATHTQPFKNFFHLFSFFFFFALSLNCHATDPNNEENSRRTRIHYTKGDEGGLTIAVAPQIAGNGSLGPIPVPARKESDSILISPFEPIENPSVRHLDRGSPSPRRRGHEISSQKPSDLFSFKPDQQLESAMVFYGPEPASSSQTFNWDSLTTFMQEMDKRFFNLSRSKRSLAAGILGGLVGCVPSTPATGTLVSSVGDFFHIPIGEGLSTGIVTWTMITTTPCFAMILGERFYTITDTLSGQQAFSTRKDLEKAIKSVEQVETELRAAYQDLDTLPSDDVVRELRKLYSESKAQQDNSEKVKLLHSKLNRAAQDYIDRELRKIESTPCIVELSTGHTAAIGLLVFASGLDAVVNVGVVALAYIKNFPNVFYGTGWAYLGLWGTRYYETGRARIDRLFCKYAYDTQVSHQKRLLMLESLENCQKAIAKSDAFVKKLHNHIFNKMNINRLIDPEVGNQEVFALSALFLQSATTMNYEANSSENQADEQTELLTANARLMNFQAQQDVPLAWKEEFLDYLNTALTYAATVGRAVTMEYVLEQLLINMFSMPALTANGIAWAASIFDTLFRSFTEVDTQEKYMRGWRNAFSLEHLGDFQWFRKTLGWTSFINGSLFSLAKTVAGIIAFNVWDAPTMVQIICLAPAFIQDQAYYGAFFEDGKDKLITNVATTKQPSLEDNIEIKRAWLMKWSRKIKELLSSQWDSGTIGNLYTLILKGF